MEQTLHKKRSGSCIFPAGGSIERRLGRSRAPPVPPSTHLLCPHLAPHVDDAGLPAAVAQQVLPQVAAGLIKALQWGESSVTSTETTNPPHKTSQAPCRGGWVQRAAAEGQGGGDESRPEAPMSSGTRGVRAPASYWAVWDKTLPPSLGHSSPWRVPGLANRHFLINPCILEVCPRLSLLPACQCLSQGKSTSRAFGLEKLEPGAGSALRFLSWIFPQGWWDAGRETSLEAEPQCPLPGLTSSVQKEHSLSTRMHSEQLLARLCTQGLSGGRGENAGKKKGEQWKGCPHPWGSQRRLCWVV